MTRGILSLSRLQKNTKTRKFTARIERSGEKAKNVGGQVLLLPGKNQEAGVFSHRYSFLHTEYY